jgi:hypothetical protein
VGIVTLLSLVLTLTGAARAQGNYEVQVYGSDTTPAGATMLEFHTNFTVRGIRTSEGGVRPAYHALHETVEITHGWNSWFETGFYTFLSRQPDGSYHWVGTNLRPRVAVPEKWGLPVGLGLSVELGYTRPGFSADTWGIEIRPIVDKKMGRFYWAFNPTLERSFHGPETTNGVGFSPNVKLAYDITRKVTGGVEYYGAYGRLWGFDPLREQQHAIMPALDLNLGDRWECNIGVGLGVTGATDRLLVKWILGYRLGGRK